MIRRVGNLPESRKKGGGEEIIQKSVMMPKISSSIAERKIWKASPGSKTKQIDF